jgi:hypothetical protein
MFSEQTSERGRNSPLPYQHGEAPLFHAAMALWSKRLSAAFINRATWTADHLPPRAAGMPRPSKPDAMARRDSQPAARSSLTVGARSIARLRSCACRAALPALVRAEIIPASSSATAAICCNRNLPVAPSIIGRSANRTSTPASSRRDRKATERVSQSTLVTTSGTWCTRAAASVRLVPRLVRTNCPSDGVTEAEHNSRWPPQRPPLRRAVVSPRPDKWGDKCRTSPARGTNPQPCQSAAPQRCRAGAKGQPSSGSREEDSGGSPCPSCSVRWVEAFNLPTRRTS